MLLCLSAFPLFGSIEACSSITGKRRYQRMLQACDAVRMDGRIPTTWEVVSAHACGPPMGQPRRVDGGQIASFPIDRLRGSRR